MDSELARARLIQERERLDVATGELASELDLDVSEQASVGELSSVDQHPADLATETFEREKETAILTTLRARQSEVEEALKRVEDGNYGSCETCGEPIGEDRLEAFPAARFCIEHQSQQEA